jgi:hypothetical protein
MAEGGGVPARHSAGGLARQTEPNNKQRTKQVSGWVGGLPFARSRPPTPPFSFQPVILHRLLLHLLGHYRRRPFWLAAVPATAAAYIYLPDAALDVVHLPCPALPRCLFYFAGSRKSALCDNRSRAPTRTSCYQPPRSPSQSLAHDRNLTRYYEKAYEGGRNGAVSSNSSSSSRNGSSGSNGNGTGSPLELDSDPEHEQEVV